MLTEYDEFPVHQYAYPFSKLPVTDLNWDDGYYFGVYNREARIFLYTGIRVAPNADIVGGYAGVSIGGVQRTVRVSRIWRPDFSVAIGPLRYEFVTAFRDIRLTLEPNDSGLSFDLHWLGLAAPYEEAHHVAENRGRRTTDQTRYSQGGTARGWIDVCGKRYEVEPFEWFADRDHSWGLYEPRSPLSDPREWLPPAEPAKRAFRFWMTFQSPELCGFHAFHEDAEGNQDGLNDVFGTPFEGAVDFGIDSGRPRIRFVRGAHRLRFVPGTRMLSGGTIDLEDELGRSWRQEFDVVCPPWATFPIGYYAGTWRDGGNIHTYHGTDEPYLEWDVMDFSVQPVDHELYTGRRLVGVYGAEYLVSARTEGPEGVAEGLGHVEFFMSRRYRRYRPDERGST